jgi:hypothetical protein
VAILLLPNDMNDEMCDAEGDEFYSTAGYIKKFQTPHGIWNFCLDVLYNLFTTTWAMLF